MLARTREPKNKRRFNHNNRFAEPDDAREHLLDQCGGVSIFAVAEQIKGGPAWMGSIQTGPPIPEASGRRVEICLIPMTSHPDSDAADRSRLRG